MARYLFIITLLLLLGSCGAGPSSGSAKSSSEFLPQGFVVMDSTTGQLNSDEYPDMILIAKKADEASTSTMDAPTLRPLMILMGNPGGLYTLAARNDKTVFCVNCSNTGEEPFSDVKMRQGYFSIEHYGGSTQKWGYTVSFQFSDVDSSWYLDKVTTVNYTYTEDGMKTDEKEKTSSDFGKVKFQDFDIYKKEETSQPLASPAI